MDDLIVNERPNAYYAKPDAEYTPELGAAYDALKAAGGKPSGVSDFIWGEARDAVAYAKERTTREIHWRVISEDGKQRAIMLVNGQVPKVPMTAPWLAWINYTECGIPPKFDSRYATVCTPYIFNK